MGCYYSVDRLVSTRPQEYNLPVTRYFTIWVLVITMEQMGALGECTRYVVVARRKPRQTKAKRDSSVAVDSFAEEEMEASGEEEARTVRHEKRFNPFFFSSVRSGKL